MLASVICTSTVASYVAINIATCMNISIYYGYIASYYNVRIATYKFLFYIYVETKPRL